MDDVKLRLFRAQDKARKTRTEHVDAEKELEAIHAEIANKPHLATRVSDHALVKFMERLLGEDLQRHRTQILNMVDNADKMDEQNISNQGIQYKYSTTGPKAKPVIFIVKDNVVTTTYTPEPKS